MNVLTTVLNTLKLREAKKGQHREAILLQGTVEPGQTNTYKVEIGTAGTIVTCRMSGYFSTLDIVGGKLIDDGVCHLRGQLIDTDGNLSLYNDFVPLALTLSPGRIKVKEMIVGGVLTTVDNYLKASAGVADAASASGYLYEMQEFTHPFTVNSYIRMDVKNDSAAPNKFAIYFDCIRVTRK